MGTSAPNTSGVFGICIFHNFDSERSVAAASAEPPPNPASTGRFFIKLICALPSGNKNLAAFITILSVSFGTLSAKGPSIVNFNSLEGLTSIMSPILAKVTKLCSS